MPKICIWNVRYELGNTGRVSGLSTNPLGRKEALASAETITNNGWRCWVEHHESKKRIFQNPAEELHQKSLTDEFIKFAKEKSHAAIQPGD